MIETETSHPTLLLAARVIDMLALGALVAATF